MASAIQLNLQGDSLYMLNNGHAELVCRYTFPNETSFHNPQFLHDVFDNDVLIGLPDGSLFILTSIGQMLIFHPASNTFDDLGF
jgi:hypothetical protein